MEFTLYMLGHLGLGFTNAVRIKRGMKLVPVTAADDTHDLPSSLRKNFNCPPVSAETT